MEELFAVDLTSVGVLVALVVFVVFVVIYKSRQQGTTYYSGDNKYSSEDMEEVRDYQDEKHKQNSKSNKKKNKKRNKNSKSDEEKNIDFATIWAFCMIGLYFFNRTDFVLVFKWSFVLAGVVYTLIKLFVPVEIIKAFTSKDD